MKILAGRREDIIKQRDEYEADYNSRKSEYEKQYGKFRSAEYDALAAAQEDLSNQLTRFESLEFDVSARRNYDGSGIAVRVMCNEHNKFSQDSALSWNYNVQLDKDGQVIKETSSWSGLKATTESQMSSLIETVEALKYLNKVDWAKFLNRTLPEYEDFVTDCAPSRQGRPDFEKQLREADVEAVLGTNKAIRGIPNSGKAFRGQVYYLVTKESPKQYTVVEIHETKLSEGPSGGYEYRISKDVFLRDNIPQTIETIGVPVK